MLGVALVGSVTTEWMFVSQIALFARVSDPSIAGTYITFLNTMANLGNKLPPTATFFLVDWLGTFEDTDGFLLMTAACTIVGVLWYLVAAGPVRRMQQVELSAWRVGGGGRKAEKRRKAE
jgi:PAT family acetyl-CoA transporter-like MFS transporter 1